MVTKTSNNANVEPPAPEVEVDITAVDADLLRRTGRELAYWALLGRFAFHLAAIAERGALLDPAGARVAFAEYCLNLSFDFTADQNFTRLVLMADAVIAMGENGQTIGTAIPAGSAKH